MNDIQGNREELSISMIIRLSNIKAASIFFIKVDATSFLGRYADALLLCIRNIPKGKLISKHLPVPGLEIFELIGG